MKTFYLIGALFFTVIILIISFENIQAMCTYLQVFFWPIKTQVSPTFMIFGLSLVGMVTGAFYYGFILELLRGGKSDEDEDTDF